MANRVVLVGRVATEPELKYTPSGIAVANFRIAVDRPFQNPNEEKQADFFTVKVWREQAERVANYLAKGQLVAVDGRLEYRTWDAQDGTKRSATEVIANTVTFQDPAQMMFSVISAASQIQAECLRLLNRVSSGDGGGPRDGEGFGDRGGVANDRPAFAGGERPAYAGRPAGGGFERPAAPAAPAAGASEEPDFGDPFADQ